MTTRLARTTRSRPAPQPPLPSLRPLTAINDTSAQSAAEARPKAQQEEQDFRALKRRIDNLAKEAGLQGKVKVTVRRRGLVIQLLTDKVFFDSGDATLKPAAHQAGRQDRRRRARRAQAPGRRRGPHRLAADLRLAVPLQLGAVRRTRRGGRPGFRRQRRAGPPGLPLRLRQPGADRLEFDAPTGDRRTDGSRSSSPASTPTRSHNPAHGGAHHHGQEDRPSHRRPARSRRRLQVRHRQADGQGRAQAEGPRHRLHAPEGVPRQPRRRAASRSCRSASCWPTTTSSTVPAGGGHGAARRRPRATAPMAQEGVVRDVITDDLTDAEDNELIESRGSPAPQGRDPQGHQEAHRCKGRARPLLRRHRPVRHPMAETVDYAPFETTTAGPVEPSAPRPSRPRSSRACTTCPSSWRSRWGARKMTIREALALGPGSIVTLNRLAGEPVDLLVNGKPIARGEVVVIDEEFGLRVTEVLAPKAPTRPTRRRSTASAARLVLRAVCIAPPEPSPPSGARPTRTASPASRRWWRTTCCCRSSRWR